MIPILMFVGAIVTFAFLPSFKTEIHIPIHFFFLSFFFLAIYLMHKIIQNKIEGGRHYKGKYARWMVKYFHCDPDYSIRDVTQGSHNSIDLFQKEMDNV